MLPYGRWNDNGPISSNEKYYPRVRALPIIGLLRWGRKDCPFFIVQLVIGGNSDF
jgi:hypothetical protein